MFLELKLESHNEKRFELYIYSNNNNNTKPTCRLPVRKQRKHLFPFPQNCSSSSNRVWISRHTRTAVLCGKSKRKTITITTFKFIIGKLQWLCTLQN